MSLNISLSAAEALYRQISLKFARQDAALQATSKELDAAREMVDIAREAQKQLDLTSGGKRK